MKPGFLGIGAQKCASTWIYRVLEAHPDTCMSSPKELDFFSYHYHFGFNWYESHFLDCGSALIAGDNSPSYFCDPLAAERAFAYNPDFKVVVALRDPIKRMYSNHLHEIRLGHIDDGMTFETGLQNNPMYIEQSRYGHHLAFWFKAFPKAQILVLFQEDIQRDPEGEASKLLSFLGLDPMSNVSAVKKRSNSSEVPRYGWLESLFRGVGKLLRKCGLSRFADEVRAISWVDCLRRKNRVHLSDNTPPMDPETEEKLVSLLEEDSRQLSKLLDGARLPWSYRYPGINSKLA